MDRLHAIDNFFHSLEKLDTESLLKTFIHTAEVHTPIRDNAKATEYFPDLVMNTKSMRIKVKHIFQCVDKPDMMAAHFSFTWDLPGGMIQDREAVGLFTFELNNDKVKDLKVLYNAAKCEHILETALHS